MARSDQFDVVTGAFGYTGKYITRLLLANGARVKTLTGHPGRPSPFGGKIRAAPFNFDNPTALLDELSGERQSGYREQWSYRMAGW